MRPKDIPSISVDLELTNRCNAKCHFCPRDATPHQGLMTPAVFTQSLQRAVELREQLDDGFAEKLKVSLCGLGEPLLNRHAAEFVGQVRAEGMRCAMSSNGAILDESRANALLDAGLQEIYLNVGERGDDYEAVYHLPWDKTFENVVRFVEMAEGRCDVQLVLVDHRRSRDHLEEMKTFWRGHGIDSFLGLGIMNRGGSLFVDEMQYVTFPERAEAIERLGGDDNAVVCPVPFMFVFVGYDGNQYLCCSDWEKKVPLGHVDDTSFADSLAAKFQHVLSREPICSGCNHDPINNLTDALRSEAHGEMTPEAVLGATAGLTALSGAVTEWIDEIAPGAVAEGTDLARAMPAPERPAGRKSIPVTVV